ncbi:L,D-transpeptidase [Streptomyces sp. NBC_00083]|uniref:L,D-transpeptidase family protein n=1 Tax=Streptomyces sp. NBC_00083 TaxID=2975647 RepID=UPI002250F5B9|nr:L,D-transpeptidase family protein [Streptomyces sp. NBC_00083]MCX5383502.1 L,D-transpeptidase family protein [Streptomyces sp. NBC_00083]
MRLAALLLASLLLPLAAPGPAAAGPSAPLPERMARTGGGSQLLTAQAAGLGSTTGRLTWWDLRDGRWVAAGSAPARFGAKGLTEGDTRVQGTNTTPTGLYALPYAFGVAAAPPGTRYPYRRATDRSWWCQDNESRAYNRWVEVLPKDCRAAESEHLTAYASQYARALVIGFNYQHPVRGRGAGIFLHVNGRGATAGCVSVSAEAMDRVLAWAVFARRPHIAIGTDTGPTAITRY